MCYQRGIVCRGVGTGIPVDFTSWYGRGSIPNNDTIRDMDYVSEICVFNLLSAWSRPRVVIMKLHTFLTWSSQAGASALGTLFNTIVVGMVCLPLGLAIDRSHMMFVGMSADAMNTVGYLQVAFYAAPFLYFIMSIINHWLSEKSAANQNV